MQPRLEPFTNDSIYHVFNKTIDKRRIFETDKLCELFLKLITYYRSSEAKISFSLLERLEPEILENLLKKVKLKNFFKIEILAYCLMPTHYHLLLRQKIENGVPRFISDVLNSFTRNFNVKNERAGPIFLPKFKSVMVKSDEQLMHVSRYIHLNPFSGNLVPNLQKLESYRWSSYSSYLAKKKNSLINTKEVMHLFNFDSIRYRRFVESSADYQRTLERIKYAEKW